MEPAPCPLCETPRWVGHLTCPDRLAPGGRGFALVRCACGVIATDPRSSPDEIGAYYPVERYDPFVSATGRSGTFGRGYALARAFWLRWKRIVVERHAAREGALLDIGCGTGEFLACMARGRRWRVKGLEADPRAATYARERLGLEVVCARLPDNPFGESAFDVVTGWHVLEHLHDPLGALGAIRAMLRPGGALVLALPNPASLDARFFGSAWVAYDAPRHLYHYTPQALRALLARAGFAVVHQGQMALDAVYNVLLSVPLGFRLGLLRGAWGGALAPSVLAASLVAGVRGPGSAMLYVARRSP